MSRRYAIIGTHNAGKTTLCHTVVSILMRRGTSVGLALEPSRRSRYLAAGIRGYATQLEIFSATVLNEIEASRNNEIVICDRSIIDVLAYTNSLTEPPAGTEVFAKQAMEAFAHHYAHSYTAFFIPQWKFSMDDSNDNLKIFSCEFQAIIASRIYHHLSRLGVPFIKLASPNSAAEEIVAHIESS
jgi:predicted ATPase